MNVKTLISTVLILTIFLSAFQKHTEINPENSVTNPTFTTDSLALTNTVENHFQLLYSELNAQELGLDFAAFQYAWTGYQNFLKTGYLHNQRYLSIIDFSKPSTEKRFFTIDLEAKKIIYKTLVSHGRNSGDNYCSKFSDTPNSHMSSIGFYVTGTTYMGSNDYSLKLFGYEKGYNTHLNERAVVIHSAEYVSERYISSYGRLGRSYGCPALPVSEHKEIINTIKNGTLIFAYYPDDNYLKSSPFLKSI